MRISAGREENGQVGLLLNRSASIRLNARWTALPQSLDSIRGEMEALFQPSMKGTTTRPFVAALLRVTKGVVILNTLFVILNEVKDLAFRLEIKGDSFLVSHVDEFATEVELLRQNHKFLTLLDEFKENQDTISLAQVEQQLR